ncbi:hypothetical protein [Bradyrhizobium sp.]|uniref:hypothetical protein n=1 Tax=Bradyrhizobium sp. TaxID=376 RepID=UPI003C6ED26A
MRSWLLVSGSAAVALGPPRAGAVLALLYSGGNAREDGAGLIGFVRGSCAAFTPTG